MPKDFIEWLIDLRRWFHQYPEPAYKEIKTAGKICEILESLNVPFQSGVGKTGIVARLDGKSPGPVVAFRADMDALPIEEQTNTPYSSREKGIMHACGHDSHTAVLLGTAIALAHLRNELPGNIRFIFQPAEEITDGGSSQMIAHGALKGVKAIFGLHAYPYLPTGQIGYKYGVMLASADTFTFEIFGKSSHGARPHEGVDAILVSSMVVSSLNHIVSRQIDPLHPAVISLGTIEGGKAPNIICDYVKVCGTVRTVNHDVRKMIPKMIEISIKGICRSMHAHYKFDYTFGSPEVNNHTAMVDLLVDEAKQIIGERNTVNLIDPVMGGEDFGRYLEKVPGAFFRLGVCTKEKGTCYAQHNSRFNVDDDALITGMKVMCATALRSIKDA